MEVIQSFTIDHQVSAMDSHAERGTHYHAQTCGNYLLHDLPMCLWESRRYLERLQHDFHSEYTPLQVTLQDGKVFADA